MKFSLLAAMNLLIEPPLLYLLMISTSGPPLLGWHEMLSRLL